MFLENDNANRLPNMMVSEEKRLKVPITCWKRNRQFACLTPQRKQTNR